MLYKPLWPGEPNDLLERKESLKYFFDVCFHTEKEGHRKQGQGQFLLLGINFQTRFSAKGRTRKGISDLNSEENICVHCPGTSGGLVTVHLTDDLRSQTI